MAITKLGISVRRSLELHNIVTNAPIGNVAAQSYIRINADQPNTANGRKLQPSHPEKCAVCDRFLVVVSGGKTPTDLGPNAWKHMVELPGWAETRLRFETSTGLVNVWLCKTCTSGKTVDEIDSRLRSAISA